MRIDFQRYFRIMIKFNTIFRILGGNFLLGLTITIGPLISYIINFKTLGVDKYWPIIIGQILYEIFLVVLVRSNEQRLLRNASRNSLQVNLNHFLKFRLLLLVPLIIITSLVLSFLKQPIVLFYLIAGSSLIFNIESIYQAREKQLNLAVMKFVQMSFFLVVSLINIYFKSSIIIAAAFMITTMCFNMLSFLRMRHSLRCGFGFFVSTRSSIKNFYTLSFRILMNRLIWFLNSKSIHLIFARMLAPEFLVIYDFYFKIFGSIATLANLINSAVGPQILKRTVLRWHAVLFSSLGVIFVGLVIYFIVGKFEGFVLGNVETIYGLRELTFFNMVVLVCSSIVGSQLLLTSKNTKHFYKSGIITLVVQYFVLVVVLSYFNQYDISLLVPLSVSLSVELIMRLNYARKI